MEGNKYWYFSSQKTLINMNHIRIFQIAIPLVLALYALYLLNQVRVQKVAFREVLVPLVVLAIIGLVALLPDKIAKILSGILEIESRENTILIIAIGILFFLVFRLSESNRQLKKKLVDLTIAFAVQNPDEIEEKIIE